MKIATFIGLALAAAPAFGTSVFRTITQTPYNAGRYTISVDGKANSRGGARYRIVIHPRAGKLPGSLRAKLSKLDSRPGRFNAIPKRALSLVARGNDRVITFDVSKAEVAALSFELDEYGEVNGRLMPSLTAHFFPLRQPPKKAASR